MNQQVSFDAIFVDNNPSWPTTLGHINEISKKLETHKILDYLWDIIRGSGAKGIAYFLSTNISDVEGMSGVNVYQYGSALERSAEIRRTYKQVSEANTKDMEILPSGCQKGSTISCPVFGPYNSKGLYIIQCHKPPEHILSTEMETLNYILLKSQIYIAEIEAKQKIEETALSKREIQVLEQLIKGESNKEIAQNLGVSVHTVNGYVRFLMLKLNVNDRVSACMAGLSILQ